MADNSGSNVAIIAIIAIAVLVAGAVFLYLDSQSATGPNVIERETIREPAVIERNTTIIQEEPAPEPLPEEGGKASIEHQNEDGSKTEIQVED